MKEGEEFRREGGREWDREGLIGRKRADRREGGTISNSVLTFFDSTEKGRNG